MRNLKEESFEFRQDLKRTIQILRFFWRYRSHPEALEPFLASLKALGVPETNVSDARKIAIAWRKAYLDQEATYRVNRYLTAGIGVADLVLLPVILPMGVPDRPLFIAVLSLAISLVLVSSSLFVSFVKREVGITSYGKMHSTLIFLSLLSGVSALTATFWHISSLVGALFLVLAVLAYIMCVGYVALVREGWGVLQMLQAASNTSTPNTGAPSEPQES
jgi:hypothetical protein